MFNFRLIPLDRITITQQDSYYLCYSILLHCYYSDTTQKYLHLFHQSSYPVTPEQPCIYSNRLVAQLFQGNSTMAHHYEWPLGAKNVQDLTSKVRRLRWHLRCLRCHLTCLTCHLTHLTCHLICLTCHLRRLTLHVKSQTFFAPNGHLYITALLQQGTCALCTNIGLCVTRHKNLCAYDEDSEHMVQTNMP